MAHQLIAWVGVPSAGRLLSETVIEFAPSKSTETPLAAHLVQDTPMIDDDMLAWTYTCFLAMRNHKLQNWCIRHRAS